MSPLNNDSGASLGPLLLMEDSAHGFAAFEDVETQTHLKSKLRRLGDPARRMADATTSATAMVTSASASTTTAATGAAADLGASKFAAGGTGSNSGSGSGRDWRRESESEETGGARNGFGNGYGCGKPVENGWKQVEQDRVAMESEAKLNTDPPYVGNRINNAYSTTMPIKKRRIQLHAFSTPSPPSSPSSVRPSNPSTDPPMVHGMPQESICQSEVCLDDPNLPSDRFKNPSTSSFAMDSSDKGDDFAKPSTGSGQRDERGGDGFVYPRSGGTGTDDSDSRGIETTVPSNLGSSCSNPSNAESKTSSENDASFFTEGSDKGRHKRVSPNANRPESLCSPDSNEAFVIKEGARYSSSLKRKETSMASGYTTNPNGYGDLGSSDPCCSSDHASDDVDRKTKNVEPFNGSGQSVVRTSDEKPGALKSVCSEGNDPSNGCLSGGGIQLPFQAAEMGSSFSTEGKTEGNEFKSDFVIAGHKSVSTSGKSIIPGANDSDANGGGCESESNTSEKDVHTDQGILERIKEFHTSNSADVSIPSSAAKEMNPETESEEKALNSFPPGDKPSNRNDQRQLNDIDSSSWEKRADARSKELPSSMDSPNEVKCDKASILAVAMPWNGQVDDDDMGMDKVDYDDSPYERDVDLGSEKGRVTGDQYISAYSPENKIFDEIEDAEKNPSYGDEKFLCKDESTSLSESLVEAKTFHDHTTPKIDRRISEERDADSDKDERKFEEKDLNRTEHLSCGSGSQSLQRNKETGWDKLPEGFDKPEEALKAMKEETFRLGRSGNLRYHSGKGTDGIFSERAYLNGRVSTAPHHRYGRVYNEDMNWSRQDYFRVSRFHYSHDSRRLHPYPHPFSHPNPRHMENLRDYDHEVWLETRSGKGESFGERETFPTSRSVSPSRTSFSGSVDFRDRDIPEPPAHHPPGGTSDSFRRFPARSRGTRGSSEAWEPLRPPHLSLGFDLGSVRNIESSSGGNLGFDSMDFESGINLGIDRNARPGMSGRIHSSLHEKSEGRFSHSQNHSPSYSNAHSNFSRLNGPFRRDVHMYPHERPRFEHRDWANKSYDSSYSASRYHCRFPSHSQSPSRGRVRSRSQSRSESRGRSRSRSRSTNKSKSPAGDRSRCARVSSSKGSGSSMSNQGRSEDPDVEVENESKPLYTEGNPIRDGDRDKYKRGMEETNSTNYVKYDVGRSVSSMDLEGGRNGGLGNEYMKYESEKNEDEKERMDERGNSKVKKAESEIDQDRDRESYRGNAKEKDQEVTRAKEREEIHERIREGEKPFKRERFEFLGSKERERTWMRDRDVERDLFYSSSRHHRPSSRRFSPHVIHGSALTDERDRMVLAGMKRFPSRGEKSKHPSREGSTSRSAEGDKDRMVFLEKDEGNEKDGTNHSRQLNG